MADDGYTIPAGACGQPDHQSNCYCDLDTPERRALFDEAKRTPNVPAGFLDSHPHWRPFLEAAAPKLSASDMLNLARAVCDTRQAACDRLAELGVTATPHELAEAAAAVRARIRSCVNAPNAEARFLLRSGLTVDQAASFCGVPLYRFVALLTTTRVSTAAYLAAERLLRQGVGRAEVCRRTGLSGRTVRTLCEVAGISVHAVRRLTGAGRLTPEQVELILTFAADGVAGREIARRVGVSKTVVCDFLARQRVVAA